MVLASLLQWIVNQFPGSEGQFFLSLIVGIGLILSEWTLWKLSRVAKRDYPSRVVNVGLLVASLILIGLSGSLLVVIWDQTQQAVESAKALSAVRRISFQLVLTLGVCAAAYVSAGMADRVIDRLLQQTKEITRHQGKVVSRLSIIGVYVVGLLAILSVWKINLQGLFVGAGLLGAVIGLAANETLGSLLAGFQLMFSRPFEIGDWVQIDEHEGIVTDITIFTTRIETFEGKYIMLPNDVVSSNTIINIGRKGRLRLGVEVGVDYEADPDHAMAVAKEAMKDIDKILTVPSPDVVLKQLGDSAVLLELRFWIEKPSSRRKWRAVTAVVRAVKLAYDREGIKIPYPQQEVSAREETGGFRVVDGESTVTLPEQD
ncbi:mechanosensitive ion channel family protein [Haladaptatus pallidirubidus]|uniref:Mechanosensitive ion channel family protein n=1 Tax=Haladaptatus pallidirubidus TaxID=1008152 RepID=A0AAV3UHZ7_9EURY|nr:mechanosensitive ion channel family protein [Haladaptatus pallidirubidus]